MLNTMKLKRRADEADAGAARAVCHSGHVVPAEGAIDLRRVRAHAEHHASERVVVVVALQANAPYCTFSINTVLVHS